MEASRCMTASIAADTSLTWWGHAAATSATSFSMASRFDDALNFGIITKPWM